MTGQEATTLVPRPVVVFMVLVFTALLVADVGAQFLPGSTHQASPVLDSALLVILGGVVAASRGPLPPDQGVPPAEPPPAAPIEPPGPPTQPHQPGTDGRHRAPGNP